MTGRATQQEAILTAIGGDAGLSLTSDGVARLLDVPIRHASKALGRLVMRGMVERSEQGFYALTRAGRDWLADPQPIPSGPRGPMPGVRRLTRETFRQRAWNAMRLMPTFTTAYILERAARPNERFADRNLGSFLRALVAAGVVIETPRRAKAGAPPRSGGHKVYRLARDLGEIAPRVTRKGVLDGEGRALS